MDALDRIVREVERDLQKWCDEPLQHETVPVEEEEELCLQTAVTQTSCSVEECGVQYERCGGGRRVIRKSHGSS